MGIELIDNNKYWDIIKTSNKTRKKYSKEDSENNRNYLMSVIAVNYIDLFYKSVFKKNNSFYVDIYKTNIKRGMREMKERGKIKIQIGSIRQENYIWI